MEDLLSRLLGIENISLDEGPVSLDWRSLPAAWILLLLVIGIAAAAVMVYRKERQDAGGGVKTVLAVVRAGLILWILLLLFGPMLTVDTIREKKAIVAVLVDASGSMKTKDPRAPTESQQKRLAEVCGVSQDEIQRMIRIDMVKKTLTNEKLKILEQLEKKKLQVKLYSFSKGLQPIAPGEVSSVEARGPETAIGDALRTLMDMSQRQSEKIAAVVLITDGNNNFGMDPEEVALSLEKNLVPIIPVAPGIPQPPMDIGLKEPSTVDVVLVNDQMGIDYLVTHRGFEGQEIAVNLWVREILKEEELKSSEADIEERLKTARLEDTRRYTLEGLDKDQRGKSWWTPRQKGLFELILKIDPKDDEITKKNNYATQRVRVADELVKVLYIDFLPRWEYRYLKNALIRDNTVLVHCLLTSADRDFSQEHSMPAGRPPEQIREKQNQPFFESLHEFPRELKDLLRYDAIVIGDVHPDQIGGEQTLENLLKFAADFGGGIIFMAGTRFNPDAFVGTPLEKLLPVVPTGQRQIEAPTFEKPLSYTLTEQGRTHPITKFSVEEDKNKKIWEDQETGLPGVFLYRPVKQLKHGATALVDLRDVTQKGVRSPLFVTANYGRGRVFMSLTDETWRWRYLRGDQPYFFPFWKQAMHWTRQMRLHTQKRYHIQVEKDSYSLGETVKLYGRAFDQDFNPIAEDTLEATIVPPSGNQQKLVLKRDSNSSDKVFTAEYTPKNEGRFTVKCGDPLDEKEQAQDHWLVEIKDREMLDPAMNTVRLDKLAKGSNPQSKARFLTLDEAGEIPNAIAANIIQFTETKEDDIWDSPLAYLLFAVFITLEWIARKVYRML